MKKYYPNRPLGEQFSSLNRYSSYEKLFHVKTPTQQNINEHYNIAKEYYRGMVENGPAKAFLDELLKENSESPVLNLPDGITSTINRIQQSGNLWRFVEKDKPMIVSNEDAMTIISGWEEIISLIKTNNWLGMSTSLKRLEYLIQQIQMKIDSGCDMVSISDIMNNPKSLSVALSLQGTLSLIRGAILEQETQKFLMNVLPWKIDGENSIYVTGQITLNGVSIKEDLLNIFDGLEIKNKYGQTLYYFDKGQIYERSNGQIKKAETIKLTDYEYKQLINASNLGFSAKTSKGLTVFHGGYNIKQLLMDSGGFDDQLIAQLYHMYQLGVGKNTNVYQNYAVSKIAKKILGEKNLFMVSRNQIIPTYMYIDKLLNNPLRFKNSKLPIRGENAALNSVFGVTDIVGPHI